MGAQGRPAAVGGPAAVSQRLDQLILARDHTAPSVLAVPASQRLGEADVSHVEIGELA
jgi:hypothetical protein